MNDEEWIVVPNWHRFQHYKDRNPVWIKLYTELSSTDEWFQLSWARRGILVSIWIEYALSRCRLRVNQVRHLGATWLRPGDLEALNHAGFIQIAASPDSTTYCEDKEADSRLPISKTQTGENQALPVLAERLLTEIRDATHRTRLALQGFDQRLPDVAFAMALESLQHRRARTDRKPLASEARYVVATLTTMEREEQYGR